MGENNTILKTVKLHLANNLGINPEDITEDDTFLEDLHMKPTEFSDFLEELSELELDTTELNLSTIKSVGDLVDALSSHVYTA